VDKYNIRIAIRSQHPELEVSCRIAICWKGGREGQGLRKTVRWQDLATGRCSSLAPSSRRSLEIVHQKRIPYMYVKPERFYRSKPHIKWDDLPQTRVLPHKFQAFSDTRFYRDNIQIWQILRDEKYEIWINVNFPVISLLFNYNFLNIFRTRTNVRCFCTRNRGKSVPIRKILAWISSPLPPPSIRVQAGRDLNAF